MRICFYIPGSGDGCGLRCRYGCSSSSAIEILSFGFLTRHFCSNHISLKGYDHIFFDCEVLKEDGQACWDSLLIHPASPSHRFQESRCCGKDQWWRAFWPFDWWSSGMEFFHMSYCTRYIQGTKRLLLDWSIQGRGKPLQCSPEMTDECVEKTLQEDLGACFSWLRWSISDDLWRHVVYGSSLYEGKQKHFFLKIKEGKYTRQSFFTLHV